MRIDDNHWLITRPIAHRGLWNEEFVENSIPAYQNAIDNNYPIEIDVYVTTDNVLVSFHDNTLDRMTGVSGFVYDKTYAELNQLKLKGTDNKIPTFDEVLSLCENKVPLLIEIKNQPNKKVVDMVCQRLKTYKGEFAVQSFNHLYMNRVKKIAPEFIRGVLGAKMKSTKLKPYQIFLIKKMPLNFLVKPDFISYRFTDLPLKKRKIKNKRVISWTITSKQEQEQAEKYAQNIIFEKFIPKK